MINYNNVLLLPLKYKETLFFVSYFSASINWIWKFYRENIFNQLSGNEKLLYVFLSHCQASFSTSSSSASASSSSSSLLSLYNRVMITNLSQCFPLWTSDTTSDDVLNLFGTRTRSYVSQNHTGPLVGRSVGRLVGLLI